LYYIGIKIKSIYNILDVNTLCKNPHVMLILYTDINSYVISVSNVNFLYELHYIRITFLMKIDVKTYIKY